jgi:GNAT superfamily N-acetyltransferase
MLGVDLSRQRQGIGGRLLQPVLEKADDTGVACYLETEKEKNLRFYERHGFRMVEVGRDPQQGVQTWGLLRDGTAR